MQMQGVPKAALADLLRAGKYESILDDSRLFRNRMFSASIKIANESPGVAERRYCSHNNSRRAHSVQTEPPSEEIHTVHHLIEDSTQQLEGIWRTFVCYSGEVFSGPKSYHETKCSETRIMR